MYRNDFERINEMMLQKGIFVENDCGTGKEYYTGYEYATLYDWDQYFETIVQLYLGWKTTYGRNGIEIFLDLQKDNGHIQRSTTGGEDQLTEHVKPFLAQISLVIFNRDGEIDFLRENDFHYYNRMKKYLLYWLKGQEGVHGLSFWDSACHSGMDNHHERAGLWHACFCCGIDLNCFLVRECKAFALIAEMFGKDEDAAFFRAEADRLKKTILEFMWNEEDGFFYDIDRRTGKQMNVRSIAAFATLWADVATKEQAKIIIEKHLLNPAEFKRPFPYPAYAATESGYVEGYLPGDQPGCCSWRAQTWVPTNYYVFQGLRKYGYKEEAAELAKITNENVRRIGDREYYTSESVKGSGLDPFWGWSLLAYFMPWENESGYDPTEIAFIKNEKTFL